MMGDQKGNNQQPGKNSSNSNIDHVTKGNRDKQHSDKGQ